METRSRRRSVGLGSCQGGLHEPGKRLQNWKSHSVGLPDPDIRDVSNSISHKKPTMCYISRESTVYNSCTSPNHMKCEAETHSNAAVLPMACNFGFSSVTNMSTFPFHHPLIVPGWYFCLKSGCFQQQMLVCSNTSSKHSKHS